MASVLPPGAAAEERRRAREPVAHHRARGLHRQHGAAQDAVTLELRVLRGARAGQREQFAKSLISLGRNPLCDFRFDAQLDLDVSARHAEIEVVNAQYVLRDTQSTNGTFVNGARIPGNWVLRDGDVLTFGAHGPQVAVRLLAPPFTVRATNNVGHGPASSPSAAVTPLGPVTLPPTASVFAVLTPVRVFDSRPLEAQGAVSIVAVEDGTVDITFQPAGTAVVTVVSGNQPVEAVFDAKHEVSLINAKPHGCPHRRIHTGRRGA
jgi:pSer/pThr/pTyr-binding forkhead associated (FHA) protein